MNDEVRQAQEELGTLQFSREEVELITGEKVDEDSYMRGKLLARAEVCRSILQQAKQGSSPAQKEFLKLIDAKKTDIKVINEGLSPGEVIAFIKAQACKTCTKKLIGILKGTK